MALFLAGKTDRKFFELIQASARNIVEAARNFKALSEEMARCNEFAALMREVEEKGDQLTHDLVRLLNRVFVTPFDREEILTLAVRLDDMVDGLEAATARLSIYGLTQQDPIIQGFGRILYDQARAIEAAMERLCNRQWQQVIADSVRINELENEADELLREGLRAIFQNPTDVVRLIQLKEVYETLEDTTDRGEDIANVLESVVVRNA